MYDSAIVTMLPCIGVGTGAAFIYTIIAQHPLLPSDYAKFKIRVYESVWHLVILLAYAEILYAIGIMKFDGTFQFHDVIIYWLIHDSVYYGFHYIQHKFKIGKHNIHHDQKEVYPLYAFAADPFDSFIMQLCAELPFFISLLPLGWKISRDT